MTLAKSKILHNIDGKTFILIFKMSLNKFCRHCLGQSVIIPHQTETGGVLSCLITHQNTALKYIIHGNVNHTYGWEIILTEWTYTGIMYKARLVRHVWMQMYMLNLTGWSFFFLYSLIHFYFFVKRETKIVLKVFNTILVSPCLSESTLSATSRIPNGLSISTGRSVCGP